MSWQNEGLDGLDGRMGGRAELYRAAGWTATSTAAYVPGLVIVYGCVCVAPSVRADVWAIFLALVGSDHCCGLPGVMSISHFHSITRAKRAVAPDATKTRERVP